jgi:DNA-binding beta-propeller fold protein YncE
MADIKALKCPSCGGPLEIPEDGRTTIRCNYCGTTLQVGERVASRGTDAIYSELNTQVSDLRKMGDMIRAGKKIEAIKIFRETFNVDLKEAKDAVERLMEGRPIQVGGVRIETQSSSPEYTSVFDPEAIAAAGIGTAAATSAVGCGISGVIALLVGVLVIGMGVAAFLFVPGGPLEGFNLNISESGEIVVNNPLAYASTIATYGGEGIGPGKFSDARTIGVDAAGNIYVGDYETTMVTVLDADGNYVSRWSANPGGGDSQYLLSLAVGRDGTTYAVVSTNINVLNGMTGELIGQWGYEEAFIFDDLAATSDGRLLAAWNAVSEDNIVAFDATGAPTVLATDVIHGLTGNSELSPTLTVDGLGNIYILGQFNKVVVKLSPSGTLQTRFGSDGREEGQFTAPSAIAVDSQGDIYVSDIFGIQVFDSSGRYIARFDAPGPVRDMAFSDDDILHVVTLDQTVVLMQINGN